MKKGRRSSPFPNETTILAVASEWHLSDHRSWTDAIGTLSRSPILRQCSLRIHRDINRG